MKKAVDLGLVPGLGPLVELTAIVDFAPFQSGEVVLERILGEVVLADGPGGEVAALCGEVGAVVPFVAGREELAWGA